MSPVSKNISQLRDSLLLLLFVVCMFSFSGRSPAHAKHGQTPAQVKASPAVSAIVAAPYVFKTQLPAPLKLNSDDKDLFTALQGNTGHKLRTLRLYSLEIRPRLRQCFLAFLPRIPADEDDVATLG